ncbi:hypothetical protein RV07_GL002069 [Enterococcus malodoratus]|nr:hypothetical protein RV07_GL002069 [Enterococcus malodoratus]
MICLFLSPSPVKAENTQSPTGFTVESVIPENQVDTTKTYFYLKMTPNMPQTIQVKVRSTQKEAVTVKLTIHDAISSSNGAIDYANSDPKLDKSLKQPITELVTISDKQKEVTVVNFEEKIVDYQIQPPKNFFSGIKLGSLRFVKKGEDEKQSGLTTEYAYVIALMLTEDGEPFNQGANLALKKVDLIRSKGKKVVAATIQNGQRNDDQRKYQT